jgi:vesicle transport protein SEC22
MSKTARLYRDTRTASAAGASNLDKLNGELQDVTRIMTKNMEELLWRGDSLDRAYHYFSLNISHPTFTFFYRRRNVPFVHVTSIRV